MMLRRVTTTVDSLVTIIQTLSNGGMSGHLIAKRKNKRGASEEGEIFFVHGGIVEAKTAYRSGTDALIWMSTWEDCTFSFRPSKGTEHVPLLPPDVLNRSTKALTVKDTTDPKRTLAERNVMEEKNKKKPIDTDALSVLPESLSPQGVPSRTETYDKALQILKNAEYSRAHYHVFLLIDGKRSVAELTRLTGRRKDDVSKLLRNLEKLQIIHIPD